MQESAKAVTVQIQEDPLDEESYKIELAKYNAEVERYENRRLDNFITSKVVLIADATNEGESLKRKLMKVLNLD